MATIPVLYAKLNILASHVRRVAPDVESVPVPEDADPRIAETQKILDEMAALSREWYPPTLRMMREFYGYHFSEVRRDRGVRSPWWSGFIDGVFLVSDGSSSSLYAGNLRYRSSRNITAEMEMPTIRQIIQFCAYLDTMSNSRGSVEVSGVFIDRYRANEMKLSAPLWEAVAEHFTPEERTRIVESEWVDIPAEV